jgi:hypothetical protein
VTVQHCTVEWITGMEADFLTNVHKFMRLYRADLFLSMSRYSSSERVFLYKKPQI